MKVVLKPVHESLGRALQEPLAAEERPGEGQACGEGSEGRGGGDGRALSYCGKRSRCVKSCTERPLICRSGSFPFIFLPTTTDR